MNLMLALPFTIGCLTGCLASDANGGDDDAQTTADIAQWNELAAQYDSRRSNFLGTDVQDLAAVDIPVLLSPNDGQNRTDYRYPVALDNGTTFVTALMSTDGAVGAEGPTYMLALASLVQ